MVEHACKPSTWKVLVGWGWVGRLGFQGHLQLSMSLRLTCASWDNACGRRAGTWESIPWVKCFLCKHYDLNLHPWDPCKGQTVCNPHAGVRGQTERQVAYRGLLINQPIQKGKLQGQWENISKISLRVIEKHLRHQLWSLIKQKWLCATPQYYMHTE